MIVVFFLLIVLLGVLIGFGLVWCEMIFFVMVLEWWMVFVFVELMFREFWGFDLDDVFFVVSVVVFEGMFVELVSFFFWDDVFLCVCLFYDYVLWFVFWVFFDLWDGGFFEFYYYWDYDFGYFIY